jgi:hypothetical protein
VSSICHRLYRVCGGVQRSIYQSDTYMRKHPIMSLL